jgi:hypothetical protein
VTTLELCIWKGLLKHLFIDPHYALSSPPMLLKKKNTGRVYEPVVQLHILLLTYSSCLPETAEEVDRAVAALHSAPKPCGEALKPGVDSLLLSVRGQYC